MVEPRNGYIPQIILLILRMKDVWETVLEKPLLQHLKVFISNELSHFNVSVVPFKQVQTLIPNHDLIFSFKIILDTFTEF